MEEKLNESQERLAVLRQLIREGEASTQEELSESLRKKRYDVTQSTVSRDLRRIGAIKATNAEGETVYYLPEDHRPLHASFNLDLTGLVLEVEYNESLVVVHTAPGAASLLAARMDNLREPLGILGTVSGDDTIFVAPQSTKKISSLVKKLKEEFL